MTVHRELRGRTLWITLDRPEARNAMDWETLEELGAAWLRLRDDADVWAGVVTGAGDVAFCVGADLKKLPRQIAEMRGRNVAAPPSLMGDLQIDKPIVCAINGDALGGGLETALACDLRIAASHARLGLTEAKWSLIPAGGGTQRLPRVLPLGAALELMLLAEPISAQDALRLNLVNRVVDRADLEAATTELVERLLRNGPLALRAIKQAVYGGLDMALAEGIALEQRVAAGLGATRDVAEGVTAFIQKRPPAWTAR